MYVVGNRESAKIGKTINIIHYVQSFSLVETNTWISKVTAMSLKRPLKIVQKLTVGDYTLERQDLETLLPGRWLTDQVCVDVDKV